MQNWAEETIRAYKPTIYCHINGLKTRRILITSFEHVLMVKPLIFELLLRCHKRTKHFRLSKGLVAVSTNTAN